MKRSEIYDAWAPAHGFWSPWVKPVLFAWMEENPTVPTQFERYWELGWLNEVPAGTAFVVDLPSTDGISLGLTMATLGYRPIPLYNAVPGGVHREAVDTSAIASALHYSAEALGKMNLRPDAPPVFLLDANRRGPEMLSDSVRFDNRSVSFTTDFPSSNYLLSHGIKFVVLIQYHVGQPQPDLAHTLRRWQEEGVNIYAKAIGDNSPLAPLTVDRPSQFGLFWHRALTMLGMKRDRLGGYGGYLAEASAGG